MIPNAQRRRLAYLALETPVKGTAAYTHVHEIISGLRAEGWDVELFATRRGGASSASSFGSRLVEQALLQLKLARRLRSFDAVFARSHFMAWPVSLLARLLRRPVVQEINGKPSDITITYPQLRPLRKLIEWSYRSQFRNARCLVAVTNGLGDWAEQFAGHKRIRVIPNGANTDIFNANGPKEQDLGAYVVFVGGLVAWHGIETMLRATAEASWPGNVRLVIVGDGIERTKLAGLQPGGRVAWLGRKPYEDVPPVLRGALAALCVIEDPDGRSASGVAPLKLFEAMACGVPVIVSDLPFQGALIRDQGAGIVIPSGDPRALAQAVADLAGDPERAALMGTNGATYALAHASWRARAKATSKAIANCM